MQRLRICKTMTLLTRSAYKCMWLCAVVVSVCVSSTQGAERPRVSARQSVTKTFQRAVWVCAEDRTRLQQILHRSETHTHAFTRWRTCDDDVLVCDLCCCCSDAGVVQAGSLSNTCSQIMAVVEQEQNKVLWIPDGSTWTESPRQINTLPSQ